MSGDKYMRFYSVQCVLYVPVIVQRFVRSLHILCSASVRDAGLGSSIVSTIMISSDPPTVPIPALRPIVDVQYTSRDFINQVFRLLSTPSRFHPRPILEYCSPVWYPWTQIESAFISPQIFFRRTCCPVTDYE